MSWLPGASSLRKSVNVPSPEEALKARLHAAAEQAVLQKRLTGHSGDRRYRAYEQRVAELTAYFGQASSIGQVRLGVGAQGATMFPGSELVIDLTAKVIVELLRAFWISMQPARQSMVLRNDQLVSSRLTTLKGINEDLRQSSSEVRLRINAVIHRAANDIEAQNIKSLEEAIAKKGLDGFLKPRADRFISGQRQLTASYRSLAIAVQVFQRINQELLIEIERVERNGDNRALIEMLLMNAIFVAETADAAAYLLEHFQLDGIPAIEECRRATLQDIEANENLDKSFVKTYGEDSYRDQRMIRSRFRGEVRDLWKGYMDNVAAIQANAREYAKKCDRFKAMRDNAIIQLAFLQIIQITGIVRANIQTANSFLEIGEIELKKVDEDTLYMLLGIDSGQGQRKLQQ
jgi:hypothetical protein